MAPRNAHRTLKSILYTHWIPTRFSQPRSHLQRHKIQSSDAMKVQNQSTNISEPMQRHNNNHTNQRYVK
jgi:hypothetical protein